MSQNTVAAGSAERTCDVCLQVFANARGVRLKNHLFRIHNGATIEDNMAAQQAKASQPQQAFAAQNDGRQQCDEEMQDVVPALADEAGAPLNDGEDQSLASLEEQVAGNRARSKQKLRELLQDMTHMGKEEMIQKMWEFYDSMPL
ncbi:hypothetical protein PG996_013919 [Apiospora saccharicola]|uniref:C2H2-type domain-containing protein n=1 Tax=Apiospora saccharicola TaxID=335842 RepID=A0ABR1TGU1_9PEZI